MVASATGELCVLRFTLAPEGSCQANFSDGSIVALNASGAAFHVIYRNGTCCRQLTSCTTSINRPHVTLALHLRNALSRGCPRLHYELLLDPGCTFFEPKQPPSILRWPGHADPLHVLSQDLTRTVRAACSGG